GQIQQRHQSDAPACSVHTKAGDLSRVHPRCKSSHLQTINCHHQDQTCTAMWRPHAGMARMETASSKPTHLAQLETHWTAAFNKQSDITQLTSCTFTTQANAAVDSSQLSSQMIVSLNNLVNTAVQKSDTVEQLVVSNNWLTDTVTKLQEDNTKLLISSNN
ncbi:hypothetical protein ACHAW6_014749, partial [Cyclotella cf. meneghiniana]